MIREIIPTFPESDRADLIEAANNFRLPFWDWACKKPGENGEYNYDVPKLVRIHEVEIRVPGGTSKIKNPFWQFSMPDGMSMGDPQLRANAITREPVRFATCSLQLPVRPNLIKRSTTVPKGPAATPTRMMPRKILLTWSTTTSRGFKTMMASRKIFRRGNGKPGEISRELYGTGFTGSFSSPHSRHSQPRKPI